MRALCGLTEISSNRHDLLWAIKCDMPHKCPRLARLFQHQLSALNWLGVIKIVAWAHRLDQLYQSYRYVFPLIWCGIYCASFFTWQYIYVFGNTIKYIIDVVRSIIDRHGHKTQNWPGWNWNNNISRYIFVGDLFVMVWELFIGYLTIIHLTWIQIMCTEQLMLYICMIYIVV